MNKTICFLFFSSCFIFVGCNQAGQLGQQSSAPTETYDQYDAWHGPGNYHGTYYSNEEDYNVWLGRRGGYRRGYRRHERRDDRRGDNYSGAGRAGGRGRR